MRGDLFLYDEGKKLCGFESGSLESETCLVLIGGLTDGLFCMPYVAELDVMLRSCGGGVSLVQPLFSSSYKSYGISSLNEDINELHCLMGYLANKRHKRRIYLMGHSTGCQDVVFFFKKERAADWSHLLGGIILQAPVSDREYRQYADGKLPQFAKTTNEYIQLAHELVASGVPNALMPSDAEPVPITAYRYLSLYEKNGDDDLFSSDLPPEIMKSHYARINVPAVVFLSGRDEFLPSDISVDGLKERFVTFMPLSTAVAVEILPHSDHAVSDPDGAKRLCFAISDFIVKTMDTHKQAANSAAA